MIHKGEIIKLEDVKVIIQFAEDRLDEMEGTERYDEYKAIIDRVKKAIEE